jgi:hypothetical protein
MDATEAADVIELGIRSRPRPAKATLFRCGSQDEGSVACPAIKKRGGRRARPRGGTGHSSRCL